MWYTRNRLVRGISDLQARLFGRTTANMISVWRIMMAFAIPALVLTGHASWAAAVFVVAVYLDYIDGAVARYQAAELDRCRSRRLTPEEEAGLPFIDRLRLKGCTVMGAWLDPLADKVLIQATLITLGWSLFGPWLLGTSLLLAALLTGVRPFKVWLVQQGRRKAADGRANAFGKLKMCTEVATVIALFTLGEGAISHIIMRAFLAHTLMLAAIALALLSLIFHLLPARETQ